MAAGLLPGAFVQWLDALGVDVMRPDDPWGAAERGFLQFWYPLIVMPGAAISEVALCAESHVTPTIGWHPTDSFPAKGWADAPPQLAIEVTISNDASLAARAQVAQ